MRRIALLLALIPALRAADIFDTVCRANGPVLKRVLETEELVRQSNHCVAPPMPGLLWQARIQGRVTLTILADREGKVTCVKLVEGHPLMVPVAMDAARKWTFRPMVERGGPVSFFGHLTFQFSFHSGPPKSCISPHW